MGRLTGRVACKAKVQPDVAKPRLLPVDQRKPAFRQPQQVARMNIAMHRCDLGL